VNARKCVINGINVGKVGEAYVSFEYLREKDDSLEKTLMLGGIGGRRRRG